MESWIFNNLPLAAAIACAAMAALLAIAYLVRRPSLTRFWKVVLLLAIGVLPIATATTGNISGYEAMKSRRFCASCHVMTPYAIDSQDPKSMSLAARHARNSEFGADNCYSCHADYGMFGTITTKLGGMRHTFLYVTEFRSMSLDEARDKIHIRAPFKNSNCMQCHSTENPLWNAIKDHASIVERVRSGDVSCASEGCHGPAHPFSKRGSR